MEVRAGDAGPAVSVPLRVLPAELPAATQAPQWVCNVSVPLRVLPAELRYEFYLGDAQWEAPNMFQYP